jgi:hypothetical protein
LPLWALSSTQLWGRDLANASFCVAGGERQLGSLCSSLLLCFAVFFALAVLITAVINYQRLSRLLNFFNKV